MADTTTLLSATTKTTTLGKSISLRMLSFLDSVSSPPTGFRSLGLDFLSITQILNSLSSSLSSHFTLRSQTLPPQATSELTKILTQTLKDFENLEALLEKFMEYEKGGAVGRVMKTWRSVFADKDIAKVKESLKTNKGTLKMAMLLTDINLNASLGSTTYEYGMLVVKLQRGETDTEMSEDAPFPGISELEAESKAPQELPDTPVHPRSYQQGNSGGEAATTSVSELSISDRIPELSIVSSLSPQSTHQNQLPPEPKTLLSEAPSIQEPPTEKSPDQVTEPKSLLPQAPTTTSQLSSEENAAAPPSTNPPLPSSSPKPPTIDINRSTLTFKTPTTFGTVNPSLQSALLSAIAGQKLTIIAQLLSRGVLPPTMPRNALVEAVKRSSSETSMPILKLLLEYGADPNLSAPDTGTTPLCFAMREENKEIVRLLLNYGANPNLIMENGSTAFIYVCERESIPLTFVEEMLLYGADTNVRSKRSESALYTACHRNRPELVKLLLSHGANPDLKGPELPIQGAVRYPACLSLLLQANADLKKKKGVVEVAVNYKQLTSVQLLLDAGASINEKHMDTFTPLTTAIREKRAEILSLLISRGVDLHLKGQDFPLFIATKTPSILKQLLDAGADPAKAVGVMEMAVYYNQISSVQILLDAGVSPNDKKDKFFTPLTTSIRENRPEIIALLLSRGADPNLKGQDMPLFMATKNPTILKQLLTCPSTDLGHANNKGVMEMAVYHNKIESVEILLDAGVNPNDKKDKLFTPLTTAIRDKRSDILTLLLKRGADPNLKGQDIPLVMAVKDTGVLKQLLEGGADVRACKGVIEAAVAKNNIDAIDILLDAGAGIDEKRMDLYTPLATAVRENKLPIIAHLLKRGADPNVASSAGLGLPVVIAASYADQTRLKVLLDAGADVNQQFQGKSAVMEACEKGLGDNVRFLVERGADVNAVNWGRKSAMDIAAGKGFDDIVMMLLEAM